MEPGARNMLIQYLSSMGAGLNPDPWVQNINQITQKNIAAQSQAGLIDLYKNILSGKMPGAKANLSDKGMNLTMSSDNLGFESSGNVEGHTGAVSGMGATVPNTPNQTPPTSNNLGTQQQEGFLSKLLNPTNSQSGSGNIPPSALAGLSPQDISAALSGALNIEQIRQKQIMDTFAMNSGKGDPLETEFPIPHPEAGIITQRQWSSLPTEEREFSSYIHAAKKLGAPDNELTREFFSTLEPTDREQFLRATMEDPALMASAKELAKSGATRITLGDKLEEKKAFAELGGQLYFKDPDWIGDLSKHMDSKNVRSSVLFSKDPEISKSQEKVKFIEDKITAGGGTVQEVKFADDGKTMIWTIIWPSGDIEDIKYAVRD